MQLTEFLKTFLKMEKTYDTFVLYLGSSPSLGCGSSSVLKTMRIPEAKVVVIRLPGCHRFFFFHGVDICTSAKIVVDKTV